MRKTTYVALMVAGLWTGSLRAQDHLTGTPDAWAKTGDNSTSTFRVLNSDSTELLRVQADGVVAVTSNTTTAFKINGNTNPGLFIANGTNPNGTPKRLFSLGVATGPESFISHSVADDVALRADSGGKMLFSTSPTGTTNDLTLVGGKAGIGTVTPSSYLTVLSSASGSYLDIALGRIASEARLAIAAGPGQFSSSAIAGDAILRVDDSSKRLHLMTGTGYPAMTITSTSVGISAYSPTATLEIGAWQNPTQFLQGVSQGLADGIYLNMPGNSEIHVSGLQLGSTAYPIIQSAGTSDLSLNKYTGGDVVIGNGGAHVFKVHTGTSTFDGSVTVAGTLTAGTVYANYQDVAEWVPAAQSMPAGTVVVISGDTNNTVTASTHAYDTGVAGVVSAAPGLLLGVASDSKAKIATTGRVHVRVDASKCPIRKGDLLVTSDHPGMAMKSQPLDVGGTKIHRPGTLIGKALEPLANGEGEILVLLSLQ